LSDGVIDFWCLVAGCVYNALLPARLSSHQEASGRLEVVSASTLTWLYARFM